MALIEACIFDLDGVIVDTAKYHYLAWKRLCNELGFDLTHEENEGLKGISRAESLNILLRKGRIAASEREKQEMMERKNNWYLGYVDAMDPDEILPGAETFIKMVKASGRKVGLGSASKNAKAIVAKIGLAYIFDAVIDGVKATNSKPDPQVFALGAEEMNVDPHRCVVFEDAIAGVDAALNAGMYAIGVGDKDLLHKAHKVIPGFAGVGLEIFDEI